MDDMLRFADELGPAKIIHVHEPSIGLKAVLVVDNVAAGPSIGGGKAVLYGDPKMPRADEECMAWVHLRSGQSASEEELREYCRGNIAHFKIPRWIWFVEEFPATVTGKLQKFRMREIALEKNGQGQLVLK
jgi:acyl-CoA synthetase (AMP-forming)/AMP-acid ligase II